MLKGVEETDSITDAAGVGVEGGLGPDEDGATATPMGDTVSWERDNHLLARVWTMRRMRWYSPLSGAPPER